MLPRRPSKLLNDLVGAGEERRRHIEAQRLRSLEIDHELIFRWRLYRQVGWLGTTEDAIGISGYPTELVDRIWPI